MIIAEIDYRTAEQILTCSYFTETLSIEGNYIKIDSVEMESWVLKEENKIRKKYGDNLVELEIRRFY
jgi:hypothetical protein